MLDGTTSAQSWLVVVSARSHTSEGPIFQEVIAFRSLSKVTTRKYVILLNRLRSFSC